MGQRRLITPASSARSKFGNGSVEYLFILGGGGGMFGCFSMKFMNNSCSHTKETHFLVKIPSRQIPPKMECMEEPQQSGSSPFSK